MAEERSEEINTLDGQLISIEPAPGGGVILWVEQPDGMVQGYVLSPELVLDLGRQLSALPSGSGE